MAFTGQLAVVDAKPGNVELGGSVPLTDIPRYPQVVFEVNWNANPTIEPPPEDYTDLSFRVRGFSTSRGRNNFVERIEAGTAQVILDNRDGYFNFTQSGRLLMRSCRLGAFYDGRYWPLLQGFIESYEYGYPGVDKDAVCVLTLSDGLKVLAQQQFDSAYSREYETTTTRLGSVLTAAGIGAYYRSIPSGYVDDTNNLAPIRVTEPLTPTTQTRSSTLANGSTSVTVSTSVGLVVDMDASGTGIPAQTKIASIPDSTHVTLDQGAVLSNTQVDVGATRAGTVLTGLETDPLSVGMGVSGSNRYGQSLFPASTTISAIQGGSVTLSTAMNDVLVQEGYTLASSTLANGSTSVTVSSTSNLRVGMQVSGTGIQQDTEIVSIDSGTKLTLSKPAVLSYTQIDATGARANTVLGNIDTDTLSVGMSVSLKNNRYGEAIFQSSTTIAAISGNSVTLNKATNDVAFWEGYTLSTTITNDSSSVTASSTSDLRVGMSVTRMGIPSGCIVGAITDSTHFTLSNPENSSYNKAYTLRTKDTQYPGSGGPWYTIAGISDTKDLSVGMHVGGSTYGSTYININEATLFDHTVSEVLDGDVAVSTAITETWRGPSDAGGYASGVGFTALATTNADFVAGSDGTCKVSFTAGTSQSLTFVGAVNYCKVSFTAGTSQTLTFPKPYLPVTGILDHIRQIEATERGLFLLLPNGIYQYQGSDYRPAQSAQLTFGENTGSGEIPYQEVGLVYEDTNIANEYILRNTYNGIDYPVTDSTSQSRYYKRSQVIEQSWYERVSSLPSEQRLFEPVPRLGGITVAPVANPLTWWPQLLALEVSKRVNVKRRPLGGSDILASYSQYIEQINHAVGPGDWRITFITSPVRA